ncbi:hypothetical protein PCASD_18011 [Puccinia coronata f. sp. avenae]|uniref:Uncharacterized protein n=1 Tax=Puccinia coronata f. sp. avenae TaxID=200324 RepID=A0A2N5UC62_9BASI|nr:hypothetical protein PCASD_18011 [Puccinia coronata f. sp. avenae]
MYGCGACPHAQPYTGCGRRTSQSWQKLGEPRTPKLSPKPEPRRIHPNSCGLCPHIAFGGAYKLHLRAPAPVVSLDRISALSPQAQPHRLGLRVDYPIPELDFGPVGDRFIPH